MTYLTTGHIPDFFEAAFALLGLTRREIKERFAQYPLQMVKTEKGAVLEVTAGGFALSCRMNGRNRCELVFVFIDLEDRFETILRMIGYCNRTFAYSYLLKVWVAGHRSIDLSVINHFGLATVSELGRLPKNIAANFTSAGL